MRGLVITINNPNIFYEPERLIGEGEKLGVDVDWFYYENFRIHFNESGVEIFHKGELVDFSVYDWAIPRSSVVEVGHNHTDLKTLLVDEMVSSGVLVTNYKAFLRWMNFSKLTQYYYFSKHNIPLVQSDYMAVIDENELRLGFPMIVKNTLGSLGKAVHKVGEVKKLRHYAQKYSAPRLLMQRFLLTGQDYRVFVVGDEVIGAMLRVAPDGGYISNISSGGHAKTAKLTNELRDIALKVREVFDLDLCGVDIMYDKQGKPYVLEVNRHPQFKGFEASTKVNVAKKLVSYLASESAKKNE